MTRGPTPDEVGLLPTDRLSVLVTLVGAPTVVGASCELLDGSDPLAPARPPLSWWGGDAVAGLLDRGQGLVYWPRVWGARGLLHVYRPEAAVAVVAAMSDDSWRVREMSAKVVRAHEIDAAGALTLLCADAVPRVRIAAGRSLAVVGAAEDAEAVRALVDDAEPAVARAAERALREMARRLDRNLDV